MNKKEQKAFNDALRRVAVLGALRWSEAVKPDLPPPKPTSGVRVVNGWSFNTYSKMVCKSCSSTVSHSRGDWDETTTQQPIYQYSTRLLALRALRHAMEEEYAKALADVDEQIEDERKSS